MPVVPTSGRLSLATIKLARLLERFAIRFPMFTSVAQANAAVIEQIRRTSHWLDVTIH